MARAALALLLALPVSSGFQFDRLDPEVVATLQHEDLSTAWGSDIGPNATWFAAHVARREVFLARGGGAYAPDELATLRSALLAPFVSDGAAPRTAVKGDGGGEPFGGDAAAAALLAGLGAPEPVASDAREERMSVVARLEYLFGVDASERAATAAVERLFPKPVFDLDRGDTAHVYVSAPGAAALANHTDLNDVVVFQIAGAKAWHVCTPAPAGVEAARGPTSTAPEPGRVDVAPADDRTKRPSLVELAAALARAARSARRRSI
ncbi:hypothetical protein SO694_00002414 [Aureococcus anophagefferens]|uniref:Bifunctional lysine-specific demethylase and histidyl-hydroxylase n=1 Tax=Aureococcus anophagefferens TaxID=44056 RepID=A0ABR1GD98_AURAN